MLTLVYTKHNTPNAVEFTVGLRNAKDQASLRNGDFWKGEIEKCGKVFYTTEFQNIGNAYKAAGVEVELFGKPAKVAQEPTKVVEPFVETPTETVKIDGRSKAARELRG